MPHSSLVGRFQFPIARARGRSGPARGRAAADDRLRESNCSPPTDAEAESPVNVRRHARPRAPGRSSRSSGWFGRKRVIARRPTGISSVGRMSASSASSQARARLLFGGRRHAIAAAARTRTRITSRDRGDVDAITRGFLVDAGALEPAKERLPRSCRRTVFRPRLRPCPAPVRRASRSADARATRSASRRPDVRTADKPPSARQCRLQARRHQSHASARIVARPTNGRADRALPSAHKRTRCVAIHRGAKRVKRRVAEKLVRVLPHAGRRVPPGPRRRVPWSPPCPAARRERRACRPGTASANR